METEKTIIAVKDYGVIEICLRPIMERKKISRNRLAKSSNTRFEVINKWYNNQVEKLDLDVLARICYVLDCSPEDIIKYREHSPLM